MRRSLMPRPAEQVMQDAADAEALERAIRVLTRQYDPSRGMVPERIRNTVLTLHAEVQQLRGECRSA